MDIFKSTKTIVSVLLLIGFIFVFSCNSSDMKSGETNSIVEVFNNIEFYPDRRIAYEKNENEVRFYTSDEKNGMYAKVNLKSRLFDIRNENLFNADYLLGITYNRYFLPKKYATFYKYSSGTNGTVGGNFSTIIECNELGLIKSIEKNLPESKFKYLFKYNKYGQLLKIIEDQWIDKVLIDNVYDEKGRLVSQKNDYDNVKSERKLTYDKNNNIIKENIKEKEIAPNGKVLKDETSTLFYQYNEGKMVRKHTENKDYVVEFQYDLTGDKPILIIEYYGTLDKADAKKWVNHFTKTIYTYNDNELVKEEKSEYNLINASFFTNNKWVPVNVEEQKVLAWKKFKDDTEIPASMIEKKYQYKLNAIITEVRTYSFSNQLKNGKIDSNKELINAENIKFTLDRIGRIIKKEIYNKKGLVDTQEFYY